MKLTYLILAGVLCSLPMKANPPKYFNLQGIDVVNPVKGQILIEKKGETIRKVII